MRTSVVILILLLLALPVTNAVADTAKVTYVTSQTFYIDAGQRTGVATGSMVEIVRGGEVVGHARVKEVSASRAVCATSAICSRAPASRPRRTASSSRAKSMFCYSLRPATVA